LLSSIVITVYHLIYYPLLPRAAQAPHLPSFPTRRSSDLLAGPWHEVEQRWEAARADRPRSRRTRIGCHPRTSRLERGWQPILVRDRKSTRLNSSHGSISYAVFCLKKKTKKKQRIVQVHAV